MTEQEALERCDRLINGMSVNNSTCDAFRDEEKGYPTFKKMKEFAEECKSALEKQIAKKVFQPFGTHSFKCSNCWKFVAHEVDDNCDLSQMAEWCPFCGQKLDWGNEDAE